MKAQLPPHYFDMPNVARMAAYLLYNKDGLRPDRDLADKLLHAVPRAGRIAHANRSFQERAVSYLDKIGIRQYLNIGCGFPVPQRDVHDIAPEARVAYVDYDQIVLVHARALLQTTSRVLAVRADLRMPDDIHREVGKFLDYSKPVTVILTDVLHYLPNSTELVEILRRLTRPLTTGSYLAVSHVERSPELQKAVEIYRQIDVPLTLRTRKEIEKLLKSCGFSLVKMVPAPTWKPMGTVPIEDESLPLLVDVAQKRDPER
ncbi:SAM-dependent methyltransferase [Nonomuraea endophytica]|uniref:SAM-dependent methyltransferase n=1 Tax=Nonomuraea endophytica TaxID=714136 RepID=UPI0037C88C88